MYNLLKKVVVPIVAVIAIIVSMYIMILESMDRTIPIAPSFYYYRPGLMITRGEAIDFIRKECGINITLPDLKSLGYKYVYYFREVVLDRKTSEVTRLTNAIIILGSHKPLKITLYNFTGKNITYNGKYVYTILNYVGPGKTLTKDAEPPNIKMRIVCYNESSFYKDLGLTPSAGIEEAKKRLVQQFELGLEEDKRLVGQEGEILYINDWPIVLRYEKWAVYWEHMDKIYYPNEAVIITPRYRVGFTVNDRERDFVINLCKQILGGERIE